MIRINWRPPARDLRIFAIGQIAFFALVSMSILRRDGPPAIALTIVGVSLAIGVLGAIRPSRVQWIYVGWMIAVMPIGWCLSFLLLAAVFGFVMIPLGLLLKCSGIDPLSRRFDSARVSYWTRRRPMPPAKQYFRQF